VGLRSAFAAKNSRSDPRFIDSRVESETLRNFFFANRASVGRPRSVIRRDAIIFPASREKNFSAIRSGGFPTGRDESHRLDRRSFAGGFAGQVANLSQGELDSLAGMPFSDFISTGWKPVLHRRLAIRRAYFSAIR
jgi:hypothetical protein